MTLSPPVPRGSLVAGRFRVEEVLKQSAGTATLRATDESVGKPVVLKFMDGVSGSTAARLQREANLMRTLTDDMVGTLLFATVEGSRLVLARELVMGRPLSERLAHGPLDVDGALTVGRCVALALEQAHRIGVLHRDVRTANVFIQENDSGAVHRAVLTDFGLSADERLQGALLDLPLRTVQYMAPEQSGLLRSPPDARSDLYALGTLMFECLTARVPFASATVSELLRRQMTEQPTAFGALGLDVPRVLEEIVGRLLRTDPSARYQTSRGILADVEHLERLRQGGQRDPAFVLGVYDYRRSLIEPAFVGRTQELAILHNELEAACQGEARLVLLEARSGGGKSRLLDELAQQAAHKGAWVMRGQALDHIRPPFQLLDGMVFELLGAPTEQTAGVRERVRDHAEAVCASLPPLRPLLSLQPSVRLAESLPDDATGAYMPEAFGENRSIAALRALLDALGTADRPVILLLDDCQWSDELTVRLLLQWWRGQNQTRHGNDEEDRRRWLLVVAAFRAEEVAPDHLLRQLQPSAWLRPPPLDLVDVRSLLQSMAGAIPDDATHLVAELSDGNPFMVAALLRGLVEAGDLRASDDGWHIIAGAVHAVQSSRQAAAILARRFRLLDAATMRLLSIGAILGKAFEISLAATLVGGSDAQFVDMSVEEARERLTDARDRSLVWLGSAAEPDATDRACFVHDKLRETLLDMLGESERIRLHALAAEYLEKHDPQRVFDLAHHFDAAGQSSRALPYALLAAARARGQHSLEIAERQYAIAQRGCESAGADVATRRQVEEGLGDVLMLRGHYEAAADQLQHALELAEDDLSRATVEGKLGELAFKRGDVKNASVILERALRRLGAGVPTRPIGFALGALVEIGRQTLHSLFPRSFLGRIKASTSPAMERERVRLRLFSRLAYAYWFQRGKIPCAWAHLREMNMAERWEPTAELAQAWSEHAPVMTMIPWFSRGIDYVQRSLNVRTSLGDDWGRGQSLNFYGVVLYAAGRWRECVEKCQEAMRLLERTGDLWERSTAHWHLAFCLYRLGDMRGAVETCRRVYQEATDIGDHQTRGISLGIWAKASGGSVPAELIEAALQSAGEDIHTRAELMQAEATRLLRERTAAKAVEVLERAQTMIDEAGLRQEYVAPVLPWLATALRQAIEETPAWDAATRARLLARGIRVAKRAHASARVYRNNLPHALRELATLWAIGGHPRKARRLLDESVRVASRQEARYEEALTRHVRGKLGLHFGWPDAQADWDDGLRAMEAAAWQPDDAEGARVRVSLVDRFVTLLDAGRRIVTALDAEAVYRAAESAMANLLRGRRVFLLYAPFRDDDEEYELARRAADSGRPVCGGDESAVLCAPIAVRGRCAACIVTIHHSPGQPFADDEERLAEFVSTLAGAALENSEGFAEVQALSRTLESRVAARTLELQQAAEALARTEEHMQQLQKMQAVGRLAGGVAHDFNNLLTVILTSNDLLMLQATTDTLPLMEAIRKAGRQAANLTQQLLAYSRRQERNPVQLRLNDVILDMESMVERLVGRTVEVITLLDPKLEDVRADLGQMQQVLMNLVVNARDAMPSGGRLTIETGHLKVAGTNAPEPGMPPGRYVWLSVADTGTGIDDITLKRIFEPFFTTKEVGRGTGLGLSTVYGIVRQSDGHITVQSRLGEGTRFTVYLPATSARGETAAHEPASGVEERDSDNETVLLVDDEQGVRRLTALTLEAHGYNVLQADSAADAMEILRQPPAGRRIDVILTDVVMPGMSGLSLAAHARELAPHIPVILMSGYMQDGLNTLPREANGSLPQGFAFLQKPFSSQVLRRKLREALDPIQST